MGENGKILLRGKILSTGEKFIHFNSFTQINFPYFAKKT